MMQYADKSEKRQSKKAVRVIIAAVDSITMVCFLFLIAIIITGGWKGELFHVRVSACRSENAGLALLTILFLRKLLDWHTPIRSIPLIRSINGVLARISPFVEKRAHIVLAMLIAGYIALIGTVVCMKHAAFRSHAYDLGIFSQMLWSAANGFGLNSSILGRHFLGEHFSPILYLLVPGYRIWPHPFYLLVVQTIALSVTAVPLYLLASSELKSRNWGLLFAFLFLCYQPMRNVNLYDFHEIALATPLLLAAFYFLNRGKNGLCLLMLCAALACKEEITEIVFIFGVYVFIIQKKRVFGLLLAFAGLAIFFTLILVVIPYFRNAPYAFVDRYSYLGKDIPSIVIALITSPLYVLRHVFTCDKFQYVWEVFGPVGLLSFLSPAHFLLTIPTLSQNLLSDSPAQYSTSFQYTSALTPFVFVSAVFGAKKLLLKVPAADAPTGLPCFGHSLLPTLLLLLSTVLFGNSPIWHIREYGQTPYTRLLKDNVLSRIPYDVSISAQDSFVPHLTTRRELYEFPVVNNAQYILLNSSAKSWLLINEEYFSHVQNLISTSYRIVFSNGSLLLLERKDGSTDNASQLPSEFLGKKPSY
jgi:uncharacterized membrane protein